MSEEEPIDISARDLMPNWLDDLDNPQKIAKKYADYEGGDEKRGRGKGGQGRDGGRGRLSGGGGGRRPSGGGERDRDGKGQGRGPRQGRRDGGRGRGGDRRDEERRPAPPARIEGLDVALLPEKSAIGSIAKYVRMTGRAYPMWDIARTMLGARERYRIGFRKSRDAGETAPDLVRCTLDDSLWLTREEALQHVVRSGMLSKYYRADEVEVEPPKGNFTAIAVHSKSGVVLGPPNHHEYRPNLIKLHQKRFSHVPFEWFSKEIEMRRDEETLEAWKLSKTKVRHFVHVGIREEVADSSDSEESGQESAVSDQSAGGEGEAPVAEEAAVVEEAVAAEEAVIEEAPAAEVAVIEEAPAAEDSGVEETAAVEDEAGGDALADEPEGKPEVAEEAPAAEGVVLKTEEEVAKHFSETYGDEVFKSVDKFIVSGDIKGSQLSRGLLALLRSEVETKQRAPMTLIQDLCRGLEKHGMKFFKEGKKMYVSAARPRGLEKGVEIADSPMRLLKFVEEHQGTTVMKMMAGLVPGFEAPAKGETVKEHKPTAEEMHFVSDMRWLTSEGYLVEYSYGKVRLGGEKAGGNRSKGGGKNAPTEGKDAQGEKEDNDQPESGDQPPGTEWEAAVEGVAVEEPAATVEAPVVEEVEEVAVLEEAPVVEEAPVEESTTVAEESPADVVAEEKAEEKEAG